MPPNISTRSEDETTEERWQHEDQVAYKVPIKAGSVLRIWLDNKNKWNAERADADKIYPVLSDIDPIWTDTGAWDKIPETLDISKAFWDEHRQAVQEHEAAREKKTDDGSVSIISVISTTNRGLADKTSDALDALVSANNPPRLFTRGGELVRVAYDEHEHMYYLHRVTESALVGEMARSAMYTKIQKDKTVEIDPPLRIAKDILSLPSLPFLPIGGLVETPVVRPDGSIFCQEGYDASTRLYLTHNFDLVIPEEPTKDDAKVAVAYVIDEVLHDFPFVDNASKANTVGAMLTPMLRPAISGNIPMVLFDKPMPGTGASLLVDLIAMISTGKTAAVTTAPTSEDEWRKRITSLLWGGSTLILIDNVTGTLRSNSLSSVLTASRWEDRLLGQTEIIRMENNATIMTTGNNLALEGDLARRSYWVRQDAEMVRPWERADWHHEDIRSWVSDHRTEILSALLTVVRVWYTTGCPTSDTRKIGSFEPWCETIGGILAYAGVDGFLGNLDDMYDRMDEDTIAWDEFLGCLLEHFPDGFITRNLVDAIEAGGILSDIAPEEIGEAVSKRGSATRKVGRVLKKHEGRQYPHGYKIASTTDKHSKVNMWLVEEKESTEKQPNLRGFEN